MIIFTVHSKVNKHNHLDWQPSPSPMRITQIFDYRTPRPEGRFFFAKPDDNLPLAGTKRSQSDAITDNEPITSTKISEAKKKRPRIDRKSVV